MSGDTADDCCCRDEFTCDCPFGTGDVVLSPGGWIKASGTAGPPSGTCGQCQTCEAMNSLSFAVPWLSDCTWQSPFILPTSGFNCKGPSNFNCNPLATAVNGSFSLSDCNLVDETWLAQASVTLWSNSNLPTVIQSVSFSKTITGPDLAVGISFETGDIVSPPDIDLYCVSDFSSLSVTPS